MGHLSSIIRAPGTSQKRGKLPGGRRSGVFVRVSAAAPAGSSGEVVLLEVTELDEDGQPSAFELVEDEGVAAEVYADFRQATKDLYDFAD